jgi:hypothetical protein
MEHDPAETIEPAAELRHTRDERGVRSFLLGRKFLPSPHCSDCVEVSSDFSFRVVPEKRPTALLWIGRAFRVRVFANTTNQRGEDFRLEAARASSCHLTGTAEGFVFPRGALTPLCHCSVEPVALPSRRGERKSFWGASANVARPSRPQRPSPRQRRPAFRPRKCVWRRLGHHERTPRS